MVVGRESVMYGSAWNSTGKAALFHNVNCFYMVTILLI
jgi:hypothetical protein